MLGDTFLLWIMLLCPWMKHILVLNHNYRKCPHPFHPNRCKFHFSQDSQRWENATVNIMKVARLTRLPSAVLSHLSSSGDTFDKAEQEIYPFSMEHFTREAEFWSRLMVSPMSFLNIKGIMLGIFLVAFHNIKMKWEFTIKVLLVLLIILKRNMSSSYQMALVINDFRWIVWMHIFLKLLMNHTEQLMGTQDVTSLKQINSPTERSYKIELGF